MNSNKIIIKGAREHNLKNINVEIPRGKLVVFTGLSGSGKSSLAFDTIYAEGQRRYVESLSSYARQFLGLMEKPDVDHIEGLSPAISIDQRSASANPRSTVGTITEIYDYLRLLFARVGKPHCPSCGQEISRQSVSQITERVLGFAEGTKIMILSPQVRDQKGEHRQTLEEIRKSGFVRVRIDGSVFNISDEINLDKNKKHNIEIIVDRLTIEKEPKNKQDFKTRLADSLEVALRHGKGRVIILEPESKKEHLFSELFACPRCGINLPEISPRSFSFNSPHGACPECTGLGTRLVVDPELVLPNPRLTLAEGAIRPWSRATSMSSWYLRALEAVAQKYKFSIHKPIGELRPEYLKIILFGAPGELFEIKGSGGRIYKVPYEGVIPNLERRHRESDSDYIRSEIEKYMRTYPCPLCQGKRLKKEVLGITVAGLSIDKIVEESVENLIDFFARLSSENKDRVFSEKEFLIAKQILKEIRVRLKFLEEVGLSYITLDRAASTLSGGEAQRIRLATQIGSGLTGVLYILDEPTIGLHPRDTKRLIKALEGLRDLGNSVIVVEHDRETIMAADWVVDIGPGAGEAGGQIVAVGTPENIKKSRSLTGLYLSGKKAIPLPSKRRRGNGKDIEILGAEENNLKNIDVKIPLGKFVCVTGVSGSGKSSLVYEVLAKKLSAVFHHSKQKAGKHKDIRGLEHLDKVINIDQSPIGRTPRSNPATYTGVFTNIREIFSETPEAKARGYKEGRFSFNVKGGRCETCRGEGAIKIEMHFLPDVYITCDECKGKRYNQEALEISYKNKNIAEVLEMTIGEAREFFKNIPAIASKLQILEDVGLGYMKLGQPATTLSGGEAQRVKLATELSRRATGKTLYILDEPTTGLHFDDISRLLQVLQALVDKGNSVLVIEHNLDVIKQADWVIDLGPEGGDKGGYLVAEGTPEEVSKNEKSYTGQYLKEFLK